jgi:hypothetical protein
MNDGNFIKLEMAQMAIRGNRFDEGEKMIQELLFSNLLDPEASSIAWFSYGSSKFKRFIQDESTYEEIIYAMNKAYSSDPNSAKTISDTFVSMTCALIQNYSTIIYKCLEQQKKISQEITLNKIKLVGGVILGSVLDERNKFLKYSAYTYSVIKGIELLGNSLDNKSIEERISYCTRKLKQILSDLSSLDEKLKELNKSVLEDEIVHNKTIKFILDSQDSNTIADKLVEFKNSLNQNEINLAGIVEQNEILEKMNVTSMFAKITNDMMISRNHQYKHLISNPDDILFGIKFKGGAFSNPGFIIFLYDSLLVCNVTLKGLKPVDTIFKISYSKLNLGDISVTENMMSNNLNLRYNGETYVFTCDKILNKFNQFFSV